jgi:hypothetical protein
VAKVATNAAAAVPQISLTRVSISRTVRVRPYAAHDHYRHNLALWVSSRHISASLRGSCR